jgi:hypothetical protein
MDLSAWIACWLMTRMGALPVGRWPWDTLDAPPNCKPVSRHRGNGGTFVALGERAAVQAVSVWSRHRE